ncbi:AAA family ATPase [Rhodobacteraceae bacterium Araon29]
MAELRDNFFILTGGPGSGKSTLINALRTLGVASVPESGRRIIQTQQVIGGDVLPWKDPMAYAQMELGVGLVTYCETDPTQKTAFDRGILDPLGFLTAIGQEIPEYMHQATRRFRYNRTVFIAPPWKKIYARDAERKQNFREASATYEAMVKVYDKSGYKLVELPCANVEERTEFVKEKMMASQPEMT